MTQLTNLAILGAGRWGVHLIRNFLAHPQARAIAIVDPNPERLQAIQDRYQLDDRTILTSDWASVLAMPELEAVAIATPAATHYTLVKTALQHHCHVLAEKPLTLDPQECLQLCQFAEQQQRQLMVDHTYLFHPAVTRGRELVSSGCLGELRYGYAARTNLGPVRQDVDALWDLAIHDIAIFNHWLGQTPVKVRARGTVWLQNQPSALQPAGLADLVWVELAYPNGFQATVHLCWLNPDKQRRLGVVGSQGTLIFDELSDTPLSLQLGKFEQDGDRFTPVDLRQEAIALAPAEPLAQVCDHFLSCVRANARSPISSGWVGTQLVAILSALTESLNRDVAVDVLS